MEKILLAEMDSDTQQMIRSVLPPGAQVGEAISCEEARRLFSAESFDLVLLGMLPEGEGIRLCREVRNTAHNPEVPMIMVASRCSLADKVEAFSAGVDDFVSCPFEPLELKARVGVQLARRKRIQITSAALIRGALKLSTEDHKAYRQEGAHTQELKLTPMEFRLLKFLVKNEDRVVSRGEILKEVWGSSVFVVDRVIDKHVSSLRQKMGSLGEYIDTVPRLGYQFQPKLASTA